MTGFNHALTGALIAVVVKQPALAIPLSLISHYLTDMIPHFGFTQAQVLERKFNLFVEADFVFSVLLMILLAVIFPHRILLIWSCMIAGAIPDIVWFFHRKTVKHWPNGLDKMTAYHFRLNVRSHVQHFYFDIVWFAVILTLIMYIGH